MPKFGCTARGEQTPEPHWYSSRRSSPVSSITSTAPGSPSCSPRLYPAETPPGPRHQVIRYPRPLARVYAVASGHQKIITSCHKPG